MGGWSRQVTNSKVHPLERALCINYLDFFVRRFLSVGTHTFLSCTLAYNLLIHCLFLVKMFLFWPLGELLSSFFGFLSTCLLCVPCSSCFFSAPDPQSAIFLRFSISFYKKIIFRNQDLGNPHLTTISKLSYNIVALNIS